MPVTDNNSLKLPLFHFKNLQDQPRLVHAISTRKAPGAPLLPEVQPSLPDDYRLSGWLKYNRREDIYGRRSELLAALGLDYKKVQPNLVGLQQRHTANVVIVGDEAYGAELNFEKPLPECDGVLTDRPGIPLMTTHADCPPVLLYDPVRRVIGSVHSGWRGTVGKIGLEAVRLMTERYGSRPEDILAGVGPSIGPCCYQVGEPVLSEVDRAFGSESAAELLTLQPDDSYHFDLWQAIHWTLLEAGLREENIEQSSLCTRCHNNRFFSYRATPPDQRHNYGQFVAVIMLNED